MALAAALATTRALARAENRARADRHTLPVGRRTPARRELNPIRESPGPPTRRAGAPGRSSLKKMGALNHAKLGLVPLMSVVLGFATVAQADQNPDLTGTQPAATAAVTPSETPRTAGDAAAEPERGANPPSAAAATQTGMSDPAGPVKVTASGNATSQPPA